MAEGAMKKTIAVLSLFVLLIPTAAFAAIPIRIVPDCGGGPCGLCDFFLLIKNIFDFIAYLLVPTVGAFVIFIAGFLFLTSGGNEQKVGQAKKLFAGVIIGAAIVYAAWIGVGTLINVIGKGIDGWTPESWNKFTCR